MVLQTFLPVRFLNLQVCAVLRYTQYLVIILGLAPLQTHFCLMQFGLERSTILRGAIDLAQLESLFEVANSGVELFEMKVDAGASAKDLEGVFIELDGGVGICECFFVLFELQTVSVDFPRRLV